MSESLTIDFSQPIPLFPLGTTVLLPHATVPLHVFEPRYRVMVAEALAGPGLIAMATFKGDAWKEDYEGKPPVHEHVCVGYILRHERLPDGRYYLFLQGVCRARIVEELPNEPYRLALLEPTEPQPAMDIDLEDERQQLEGLFRDDLLGQLASVAAIRNWLSREIPTAALIDLSILAMVNRPNERYAMLAEPDVHQRAHWLEHHLRDTRRTLQIANRFGPSRTDDGVNLN